MAVGQVTEKVEVSARAVLLQTDSSDRSQIITGEQTKASSTFKPRCSTGA